MSVRNSGIAQTIKEFSRLENQAEQQSDSGHRQNAAKPQACKPQEPLDQ
jgi:hypothetical protein